MGAAGRTARVRANTQQYHTTETLPVNDKAIKALNRVLRYGHETTQNLLGQLASPEHNRTRWGGPDADHTFRGVLADAIDESDRPHAPTESALLRDPDQHVVLDTEGRLRSGQHVVQPLHDAVHAIHHHLIHQYSGDSLFDSVAFSMPNVRFLSPDGTATMFENGGLLATDHVSKAGNILADRIQHRLDDLDGGAITPHDRTLQRLLANLRNVKHEDVNWKHKSNEPI